MLAWFCAAALRLSHVATPYVTALDGYHSATLPGALGLVALWNGMAVVAAVAFADAWWQRGESSFSSGDHAVATAVSAVLLAGGAFFVVLGSAPLVQPWVSPIVLWALAAWCRQQPRRGQGSWMTGAWAGVVCAGVASGFAVYVRPDCAFTLASVAGAAAWRRRRRDKHHDMGCVMHSHPSPTPSEGVESPGPTWRWWVWWTCGAVGGLVIGGSLDGWHHGHANLAFTSAVQWVRFNVVDGLAWLSGRHPWHYYATVIMQHPALCAVVVLCALNVAVAAVPWSRASSPGLWRVVSSVGSDAALSCASLCHIVLFSLSPHKEPRFLYLGCVLAAVAAGGVAARAQRSMAAWVADWLDKLGSPAKSTDRRPGSRRLHRSIRTRCRVYAVLLAVVIAWGSHSDVWWARPTHVSRWSTDAAAVSTAMRYVGRTYAQRERGHDQVAPAAPGVAFSGMWTDCSAGAWLHLPAAAPIDFQTHDEFSSDPTPFYHRIERCADGSASRDGTAQCTPVIGHLVLRWRTVNKALVGHLASHGWQVVAAVGRGGVLRALGTTHGGECAPNAGFDAAASPIHPKPLVVVLERGLGGRCQPHNDAPRGGDRLSSHPRAASSPDDARTGVEALLASNTHLAQAWSCVQRHDLEGAEMHAGTALLQASVAHAVRGFLLCV